MSLKTICIHWSAGTYQNHELDHYHFTVDDKGIVYEGHKRPESNIPKNGKSLSGQALSTYVPHCGGGNSFCIGVAMLGMAGFNTKTKATEYPLTRKQCEATWKKVAELCIKYGIEVNPKTVFTHAEFGRLHPKSESAGKIDIVHLPCYLDLREHEIGPFLRTKVQWYIDDLKKKG